MKTTRPDLAFERMLIALERDLIDATDEEILAAAKGLGMNPTMKGSAALFGVTILVRPIGGALCPSSFEDVRGQNAARQRRRRPKGDAPTST
jgi:hypothetical protein